MKYVFLFAGIWNLWGGINHMFLHEQAMQLYGFPHGNRWESLFIAGIAVVFGLIYLSFFRREPPRDMLYLVLIFAAGKYWVAGESLYCWLTQGMPPVYAVIFGGVNAVIGVMFTVYYAVRMRGTARS